MPEPTKDDKILPEPPPVLGTWPRLYTFVLVVHLILLLFFYFFSLIYS